MHNQESPHLHKEYMKRAVAHTAEEETRPDLPLSNNERQGHGHKPLYLQTLRLNKQPESATDISINTFATVNPDWDVQGTGSYHIQVNPTNQGLAGIHSPAGAFLGDITMDRLRILELARRQVLHEAPSDLAGSISALLSRYKNSLPSEHSPQTNMRNHWATPAVLMGGLNKTLKLTVERFASPLNFCPEMQQYISAKEDDQAFGAGVTAYSTPWLGASHANSVYEHAEMAKAVRWAIMSAATTQEALMTSFILPAWPRITDTCKILECTT